MSENIIEYRGFYIDVKSYTIYNDVDGKPFYYHVRPNDLKDAKRFIDDRIDNLNGKQTVILESNLCQEVVLPQATVRFIQHQHKLMDCFEYYIMRDANVNLLLLAREPDISNWFTRDPDTGMYINDIVYMLYIVYTNKF